MNDIRVFFREAQKTEWKSKSKSPPNDDSETLSDRDIKNLEELSMCIYRIRTKAKEEKKKTIYDNPTLEDFMDEFTIMIDDIARKKNIEGYISHYMGVRFGVDVPVKYVE